MILPESERSAAVAKALAIVEDPRTEILATCPEYHATDYRIHASREVQQMTEHTITSRPYSTAAACEKCVFNRGRHAAWCETAIIRDYLKGKIDEASRQFREEIPFGGVVEAQGAPR